MRADARRNRERIVDAALREFTEQGPGVLMEDIASAAGVGVGTLYRHFPDRAALAEEIGTGALRDLVEFAREHLASGESRWDALRSLVDYCAGQPFALTKALGDSTGTGSPERLGLQREADALFIAAIEAAQREGTLRRDITPAEILALLSVVVWKPGAAADDPLTTVTLDGLRSRD